MSDPIEQPEMGRRIRAAMSYGRVSRKRAAELLSVDPGHLDRYTARNAKYKPRIELLQKLAMEAQIDANWFTADLSRLGEIVAPGAPTLTTPAESPADVGESEAERIGATQPVGAPAQKPRHRKGRAA